MSTIGRMLLAKEPLFEHALYQLEVLTGRTGVDAKLAAELAETVANRTQRLGLKSDCSGPELYQALIKYVAEQDAHLAKAIGGKDATSVPEMTPLIVKAAEAAPLPKTGWFLKPERAKQLLAKQPPQAIMERLGYHLVSQLLEQEDLAEIFLALRFVETPEWLTAFDATYKSLKSTDFETQPVRIVIFDQAKWGDIAEHFIAKKRHNITHSKEMGAIAVLPMAQTEMKGVTLKLLSLLCHYYNEIHLYSTYFKLMKSKKNFGEIVATTLIADPAPIKIGSGHDIHWRVIQRYFSKLSEPHPEIFEPHVQPEDLHWRRAEEILYDIDPELEFWKDLDYVGALKGDDVVTFNLMDVSFSYSNEITYPDRYLYHFREALWNEVFARYLGEPALERELLQKLDNDVIKPEKLVLEVKK